MPPEFLTLPPGPDVPNSVLPVQVYRAAFIGLDAAGIQARLSAHGWTGAWQNGIYPFHHYHSTAHEVLVIARGHAHLTLGGEGGVPVQVQAGDALLLPAGTGHRNDHSSPELLVIGAYDRGRSWDTCRPGQTDLRLARANRDAVPPPQFDPVSGELYSLPT